MASVNGPWPELDLVLLCARTQTDLEKAERIKDFLANDIDWTDLVETAIFHHVTPLVYRNLARTCPDRVPKEILDAFETHVTRITKRNRFLTEELLGILERLMHGGIVAIPFKGPVLAQTVYGDLSLRVFRDLDFLIHEQDVGRALDILSARGYLQKDMLSPTQEAATRRLEGQVLLVRADRKVAIEPHWALTPSTLAVSLDYSGLWSRARSTGLAGTSVRGFAPEDLLIILSIHGSKEEWWRLNWICDIAELIRAYPDLDWNVSLERARSQGCLRMVLLALRLANRLLETALPPHVRRQLEGDAKVDRLANQVQRWMTERKHRQATNLSNVSLFRIRMRERSQDKVSYVLRTVTTPRPRHFEMINLPDWLFFGYYAIKLVHDYVLLPVWLLGKRVMARSGSRCNTDRRIETSH